MTGCRFSEEMKIQAISAYLAGANVIEAADLVGNTSTTVCRWVKAEGYSTNSTAKQRSRAASDSVHGSND